MFLHRLALALGRSLGELATMPIAELRSWMSYFLVEPWGEERADMRSGIVAATVANAHRGKKSSPFKPADFMPKFGRTAAMTAKEQAIYQRHMLLLHNYLAKKAKG